METFLRIDSENISVGENHICLLHLVHYKTPVLFRELVHKEVIPFVSEELAINWLVKHGFVFGQCNWLANEGEDNYWFHLHDTSWDFTEVVLEKVAIVEKVSLFEETPKWIIDKMFPNIERGEEHVRD